MIGKAVTLGLLFWAGGVMAQDGPGNDRFFWQLCIAGDEFHENPDIPMTEAE